MTHESTQSGSHAGASITAEQRQRMIAEAAYRRAEERNFAAGDPVADWLQAEQEVDGRLGATGEEGAAYEKLRASVRKLLGELREVADQQEVRRVFDQAVAEIRNSGAYAARTVSHVADSLRKDMADAAAKMGPRWEAFSEKSTDLYGVWRDRGGIFLAEAARAVGGWLEQTSTRLEQQTYRAGEVAFRGEFDCAACGGRISLGVSGPLPPCPNCGGAQLRRID